MALKCVPSAVFDWISIGIEFCYSKLSIETFQSAVFFSLNFGSDWLFVLIIIFCCSWRRCQFMNRNSGRWTSPQLQRDIFICEWGATNIVVRMTHPPPGIPHPLAYSNFKKNEIKRRRRRRMRRRKRRAASIFVQHFYWPLIRKGLGHTGIRIRTAGLRMAHIVPEPRAEMVAIFPRLHVVKVLWNY